MGSPENGENNEEMTPAGSPSATKIKEWSGEGQPTT